MSKKIIVLIFVFAVLLLVIGISLSVFDSFAIYENREYKTVDTVDAETLSQDIIPDNFSSKIQQMGFSKGSCDDIEPILCSATNQGYHGNETADTISVLYQNNKIDNFNISLNFSEEDYLISTVTSKVNLVFTNFFCTGIESNQIAEVDDMLDYDEAFPSASKDYQIGNYTENLNIQYIKEKKFYLVKILVVPTEQYES